MHLLKVCCHRSETHSKGAPGVSCSCCLSSQACPAAHACSQDLHLKKQQFCCGKTSFLCEVINPPQVMRSPSQSFSSPCLSPKILMKDIAQKQRTASNEMIKEKIQLKTPGTHYNLISHYLMGTLNIS